MYFLCINKMPVKLVSIYVCEKNNLSHFLFNLNRKFLYSKVSMSVCVAGMCSSFFFLLLLTHIFHFSPSEESEDTFEFHPFTTFLVEPSELSEKSAIVYLNRSSIYYEEEVGFISFSYFSSL